MIRTTKLMLAGGLAITALVFSSASFSACLENNVSGNDGYESEIVTEYGGSTLTCPSNHAGCTITDVVDNGYCIIPANVVTNTNALLIEIDIAPDSVPLPALPGSIIWNEWEVVDSTIEDPVTYNANGYAGGTYIPDDPVCVPGTNCQQLDSYYYAAEFDTSTAEPVGGPGNLVRARGNNDATITDTAQGAQGCFNAWGTDQFTAIAGFERDNQPGSVFETKAISFCSDGIKEITGEEEQPPPKQARCIIPSTGETAFEKYGVRVTCPLVPEGLQRTIVISEDTECIEYLDPQNPILGCKLDSNNDPLIQEVDGYGFFNANKEIDFNNVCVCVGGDDAVIHKTACIADPSYEGPNKCTVEKDANVPVSVTWQNPFCISGVSTGWCW